MINVEEQNSLLLDIARQLKREITVFAIGGTAMMFLNLKDSTKDIDLVFTSKEDRTVFIKSAKNVGWLDLDARIVYGERENIPIMLKFGDSRLDLFVNEVIDFLFSKQMQNRAEKIRQFEKNLILKIADIHDIIIMKCSAGRAKDIDDVRTIIEKNLINFDILVEEAKNQVAIGKERAILDLGTFLEKLQKLKVNIPEEVLDKLWELLNGQVKAKRKKH